MQQDSNSNCSGVVILTSTLLSGEFLLLHPHHPAVFFSCVFGMNEKHQVVFRTPFTLTLIHIPWNFTGLRHPFTFYRISRTPPSLTACQSLGYSGLSILERIIIHNHSLLLNKTFTHHSYPSFTGSCQPLDLSRRANVQSWKRISDSLYGVFWSSWNPPHLLEYFRCIGIQLEGSSKCQVQAT